MLHRLAMAFAAIAVLVLAPACMCSRASPSSSMVVEVCVEGARYSITVSSNVSIVSIGSIPNGVRIIVNETPAEIRITHSSDIFVSSVMASAPVSYRDSISGDEGVAVIVVRGRGAVDVVFSRNARPWIQLPQGSILVYASIAAIIAAAIAVLVWIRRG